MIAAGARVCVLDRGVLACSHILLPPTSNAGACAGTWRCLTYMGENTVGSTGSFSLRAAMGWVPARRMAAKSDGWRRKQDHFAREAKSQGLRSRAAFKLEQINAKHKILRPGTIRSQIPYERILVAFLQGIVVACALSHAISRVRFLVCVCTCVRIQTQGLPPPHTYTHTRMHSHTQTVVFHQLRPALCLPTHRQPRTTRVRCSRLRNLVRMLLRHLLERMV